MNGCNGNRAASQQQMTSSVELITPHKAQEYLRNNHNRPLSKRIVHGYAQQMRRGEWVLTHQGLAFSADGQLLDGQHRLSAIIASGCSVSMLVSRHVPDVAQLSMDIGAKRTVTDAAKLVYGIELHKTAAAVVRGIVEFTCGATCLSHQQVISLHELFQDAVDWVLDVTKGNHKGIGCASVRSALAIAYCYEHDLDRLWKFTVILNGHDVPYGDVDMAAIKLREMTLTVTQRSGVNRKALHMHAQRCIQAFCSYQAVKVMRATRHVYAWPLEGNVRGPSGADVAAIVSSAGEVE